MMTIAALCLLAQAPGKPVPAHEKVDQQRVDSAIEKGCKTLLFAATTFPHGRRNQPEATQGYLELIVLTLAHSGFYPETNPQMAELVNQMVSKKQITSTYTAALQAMALQKINAFRYQWRIAQCAQFLVDNQCTNGQWDYGEPTVIDDYKPPSPFPTGGSKPGTISTEAQAAKKLGGAKSDGNKTEVSSSPNPPPKTPIFKKKKGPPAGDNSNSQYAALGLRACMDSGFQIPPEVLLKAREWWIKTQNTDGGWGYNDNGGTGGSENANGVCNTSYGSMTVGAVGALCIYDFFMNQDYKKDPNVLKGVDWIAKNFDVKKNPKQTTFAYLYYLYGLERAGILFGTEKFGPFEWYPLGANHLLDNQGPGGGWVQKPDFPAKEPESTCFAILFLKRGTIPLEPPPKPNIIISGDSKKAPEKKE